MHAPLADFTTRVLTRHGALVEPDQDEIVAVMPAALAALLDVAEYQRFGFDPRVAGRGILVDHESPLVERFERLVERLGRIACVRAPRLPLKSVDAEEIMARALTLTNGIVRDCRAEPGDAQYVGFLVQFELLADERISGVTEIWVNTTTGSVPQLHGLIARLLSSREAADATADVAAFADVHGVVTEAWAAGAALARASAANRLQDALASLRRRRDRDFTQLREYYQAIDQGIRVRARRAVAKNNAAALKTETSRLEATARAFRGRVVDLIDRYRARVRLEPLVAVICTLPVHRVTARLHRRTASRIVTLAWNAIDRALELPRCDGCGTGTSVATLCDDRVHLLCSSCQRDCETCRRSYCAACHTRCPRQHR